MPDHSGVLALDLATTLGWALERPGRAPIMGSVDLRSTSQHPGAKFCTFADWFGPMLQVNRPWLVIYEAPWMTSGNRSAATMEFLVSIASVTAMICCRWDTRVVKAASSSARKFFLGNGRPENPKEAVMAECRRRGWNPVDHNAGDSACLLAYAVDLYRPGMKLPAIEPSESFI